MSEEKALELLGLLDTTGYISATDIKTAYKQMAKKTHPDRGGSAKAFKATKEAFDFLIKLHPEGFKVSSIEYDILDILTLVKVRH